MTATPAGELRQALLQLLLVVIAGGLFDLALDLLNAALDHVGLPAAADNGGRVLVDDNALGAAELTEA